MIREMSRFLRYGSIAVELNPVRQKAQLMRPPESGGGIATMSCRTAIPGAGTAPCRIGMDAVGGPHLSRKLKPTVARAVHEKSARLCARALWRTIHVGQIRPWCSISGDGSLSPDSFRAGRTAATDGVGHGRSYGPQKGRGGFAPTYGRADISNQRPSLRLSRDRAKR
jgi:hypothetical protein